MINQQKRGFDWPEQRLLKKYSAEIRKSYRMARLHPQNLVVILHAYGRPELVWVPVPVTLTPVPSQEVSHFPGSTSVTWSFWKASPNNCWKRRTSWTIDFSNLFSSNACGVFPCQKNYGLRTVKSSWRQPKCEFATSKIPHVFFAPRTYWNWLCRKGNISRWFATPLVVSVSVDHFGKNWVNGSASELTG